MIGNRSGPIVLSVESAGSVQKRQTGISNSSIEGAKLQHETEFS